MKNLEKLELLAEKKRENIKTKQKALKRDMEILKDIEAEIDHFKGEEYRKDINRLNLTNEEYEQFRRCVLADRNNLLDIISLMSQEKERQEEGERPLYE